MKSKLVTMLAIMVMAFSLVACTKKGNEAVKPSTQNSVQEENGNSESKKEVFSLYFPDDNAEYVVEEKREIENPDAMKVLKELQKGSVERNKKFMFSDDIKIKNVDIKDKIATIDFDESINGKITGSAGEILTINSITNSLILNESLGIEKVRFTQNGKLMESIGGHVDTSEPLGPSKEMIKK
ncbi:Sporulation and spore germination [Hathewaya proteolytica DSM 3090]|uniref:Sporulation and spore germination n=1 Tax=Hathewaya proteolytica DSM 3090 TaxID=1121331 RepID=A0A1M6T719_9CLOT|nr:GerMN domain-containing protein [Hathewaya proteolytica]SHK52735.1 Sporulation and spore germination [Hathewaya proteolytica DSM 3090]